MMPASTTVMDGAALGQAFQDPVLESQAVFRAVLQALSEPGTVHALEQPLQPPAGLHPSTARLLLALADFETPVWLAPELAGDCARWVAFHTGAPAAKSPGDARFAVVNAGDAAAPLALFDPGEERYPDKSATLFIQVAALDGGDSVALSGPGIPDSRTIAPAGLGAEFWRQAAANQRRYPLGVDMLLVSGDRLLGLPRSTAIARAGKEV